MDETIRCWTTLTEIQMTKGVRDFYSTIYDVNSGQK